MIATVLAANRVYVYIFLAVALIGSLWWAYQAGRESVLTDLIEARQTLFDEQREKDRLKQRVAQLEAVKAKERVVEVVAKGESQVEVLRREEDSNGGVDCVNPEQLRVLQEIATRTSTPAP